MAHGSNGAQGDPPGSAHVIIIGGGLAGLACARELAGRHQLRATLIDRTGEHQFTPLLYQVATAELAPADVSFGLAELLHRHHNLEVRTGEVAATDPATRSVTLTDGGRIGGDALVIAAGARPDFFHTAGAERYAYPLYSLDGALRIRHQLIRALENPGGAGSGDGPQQWVVVGGGPTGVETAGALADLVNDVIPALYGQGAADQIRVVLVDHGHDLLAGFSPESRRFAADRLRARGVDVRVGTAVTLVAEDHVLLSDGDALPTRLAIWAGGEQAAPVGVDAVPVGHGGRIDVDVELRVPGFERVYAVGDAANIPTGDGGTLPQLGSVALQSGQHAARNLRTELQGKDRQPFRYRDRGIMAMIDRQSAVTELGTHRHQLHGRLAFAAWLGVHADLLETAGARVGALLAWADEFYLRPFHRGAALLDPASLDTPRTRPAPPD